MPLSTDIVPQTDPKVNTLPKNALASLLLEVFGARNDVYATGKVGKDGAAYYPEEKPLTESVIAQHLAGKLAVGTYHLTKDNTVSWLGWDVDVEGDIDTARTWVIALETYLSTLPHVVEFSGGKGYHVLIFLTDPMPAVKAQQIVEHVRTAANLPKSGKGGHVEVYPKQGQLTKSLPYGNLLKLPLGQHPKTHAWSKFVDTANRWEGGPEVDPVSALNARAAPAEVERVLLVGAVDPADEVIKSLIPFWQSGNRHDMALALAGFLSGYWIQAQTTDFIQKICERAGDEETAKRLEDVEDTYNRIATGKAVKGYSGLVDLLAPTVLVKLAEFVQEKAAPSTALTIDKIRLSKGAPFMKDRRSRTFIFGDLKDKGRLIKTPQQVLYFFDDATHRLMRLDHRENPEWMNFLLKNYGLNVADSFSKVVAFAIETQASQEAETVEVCYRSKWAEGNGKLYICLGGAEVYILNGNSIETGYNGDCGYLFESAANPLPPLKGIGQYVYHPERFWSHIADDVNFVPTAEAPATTAQQRELFKAWFLSIFFQELMKTRPILAVLGPAGSGKTSALRRLLYIIEGPEANVIEAIEDKADALRVSLTEHTLIVLDNLEGNRSKWLVDSLNRASTGTDIELRKLYTTHKVFKVKPRAFVGLTAVTMPFKDETLFSRLIPLEMDKRPTYIPENVIQGQILNYLEDLWLKLLDILQTVVRNLRRKPAEPTIDHRLADFVSFCYRMTGGDEVSGLNRAALVQGLKSLGEQQAHKLIEGSAFADTVERWKVDYPAEAAEAHTVSQLHKILMPLAKAWGIDWKWKKASVLTQHIKTIEGRLVKLTGC